MGPSFGVTAREEKPAPAGTVWQVRQVEGKSAEPQKPGKTRARARAGGHGQLLIRARANSRFSAPAPYG